jgi:hypothetical protein
MRNLIMSFSHHVTGRAVVFTPMLWQLAMARSAGLIISYMYDYIYGGTFFEV